MSVYKDIQKATQIPYSEENPIFIRYQKSTLAKKKPRINKQQLPRNSNWLTDDDDDDDDDDDGKKDGNEQKYDSPRELCEDQIASFIQEANCGVNYSNKNVEEQWRTRQTRDDLKSTVKTDCSDNNPLNKVENIEDEEYLLKKCKLHKNAAIRGLLRNNKISLNDLQTPNKFNNVGEESGTHALSDIPLNDFTEGKYSMKLVQCPEEPEVFVACGKLDANEYKDIDFTVPRLDLYKDK
ncbi:uncharacterized protein LOC144475149 isoform X2 [Augochlora pura]